MDYNYEMYERLVIGEDIASIQLWHLVVISAISQSQRVCYEKQIEAKLTAKQLPRCFQYVVLSDPDECKIGSGGSTLHILHELHATYGERLLDMKLLIIHAGGYSQRMPTCSVLGKIFAPVPCASPFINDMLDLSLAVYTPFAVEMRAGVLLASSDVFLTFKFTQQVADWMATGNSATPGGHDDFVLVAHKSPLHVAKDHGVYALGGQLSASAFECRFVLQKPSLEVMHERQVVETDPDHDDLTEFAFTDSVFYFSSRVLGMLLDFHRAHFERMCATRVELDAYRDFLQPLGTEPIALADYLSSAKCAGRSEEEEGMFTDLYERLTRASTSVLALDDSRFYHLGTVGELVDAYNTRNVAPAAVSFRTSLGFCARKNATIQTVQSDHEAGDMMEAALMMLNARVHVHSLACKTFALVEYCRLEAARVRLELGEFALLSNCMLSDTEWSFASDKEDVSVLRVPSNVCLHTVAIRDEQGSQYVTVFFGKDDDLKKCYANASSVRFLGTAATADESDAKVQRDVQLTSDERGFSIWNMRLFRARTTMSESLLVALDACNRYVDSGELDTSDYANMYSLFDVLRLQDFEKMIEFRQTLIAAAE